MGKVLVLTRDNEEIEAIIKNTNDIDKAATIEWDGIYGYKIIINGDESSVKDEIYLPRWLNLAIDRKVLGDMLARQHKKRKWWQFL